MGNQGKEDPNLEQWWSAGTAGTKDTYGKIVGLEKESKEMENRRIIRK